MKINEMFHTDQVGRLVKSSNEEPIPADEPVFILRGRDVCAVKTLCLYQQLCSDALTPGDRIVALDDVINSFRKYAREAHTKVPGSTHGK